MVIHVRNFTPYMHCSYQKYFLKHLISFQEAFAHLQIGVSGDHGVVLVQHGPGAILHCLKVFHQRGKLTASAMPDTIDAQSVP